jgi:hypothetical protein
MLVFAAAATMLVVGIGLVLAGELPSKTPAQPLAAHHDRAAVKLDELSDADLKSVYIDCSQAAAQRALGAGEIAMCSTVYERLLTRTFSGDFGALLAWSRQHPDKRQQAPASR